MSRFVGIAGTTIEVRSVNKMTNLELFETGEGVIAGSDHPPFNALGVAIILELHSLPSKRVGEDTLRGAMRFLLGSTFTHDEGLTKEIGRVIGKGKPINSRIQAEAEKKRSDVRKQLLASLDRYSKKLKFASCPSDNLHSEQEEVSE